VQLPEQKAACCCILQINFCLLHQPGSSDLVRGSVQAVPFELVQVDLSDKPSWYAAINPRGLVPAVVHQGEARLESLELCRWGGCAPTACKRGSHKMVAGLCPAIARQAQQRAGSGRSASIITNSCCLNTAHLHRALSKTQGFGCCPAASSRRLLHVQVD
jgi:hypothetical protein